MPDATVRNQAIGGTITAYWTAHLAEILNMESPDVVLFYCGSNDVERGVSEEEILMNTRQCRNIVHAQSADTKFAYFSITKAPQKLGQWELIGRLNADVRQALCEGDHYPRNLILS